MKFSRKMIMGLEAVIDIATHSRPHPVQARDITKRQGVPQRYLEQVLQALVKADILRGVRGPKGGYHLARERRRISIAEIIETISEIEDSPQLPKLHSELGEKLISPLCKKLQKDIMASLSGMSVEDLCKQAQEKGLSMSKESDFTI